MLLGGTGPGAARDSIMSAKKVNGDWFQSLRSENNSGGYPGAAAGSPGAGRKSLTRSTSEQLPLRSSFRTKKLDRGPGAAPAGVPGPRSPRPPPELPRAFVPTEQLKKEKTKAQSRVLPVKDWKTSLKEHTKALDADSIKSYKNLVQQAPTTLDATSGNRLQRAATAFTPYSTRSKHTGLDDVSVNESTHTIHQGGFVDGRVLKRDRIAEKSSPLRVKDWSANLRGG